MSEIPAIRIRRLHVVRGHQSILRDLDLDIASGAVTSLLGPSGSGKTTLMRAIVGVQRLTAGTIEVLGQPANAAALRSHVGYVTQAHAIYADLTVRENIEYLRVSSMRPAAPSGMSSHVLG